MSIKERPILFAGSMVQALLAGAKTQTRRVVKPQPHDSVDDHIGAIEVGTYHPTVVRRGQEEPGPAEFGAYSVDGRNTWRCPYGQPGDRLWVRETFRGPLNDGSFGYRATHDGMFTWESYTWKPSIHMPRAAGRITLEVTGVRVERLQDISRGDAMAEGCPFPNMRVGADPRKWYEALWGAINGADSWDANPWVWVVEFKRITP
jgi:hypothetical protein